MRFSDLVRGASLRGAPDVFSFSASLRLGRAIGVLLRRRGLSASTTLVGRSGGPAEARVRDGIVAGFLASGLSVADLGVVLSDQFTAALRRGPARGVRGASSWPVGTGVLISATGESVGVMLFEGTRPLVGEHLGVVARLADEGLCVSVDGGQVILVDARQLSTAAVDNGADGADGADDDASGEQAVAS